MDDRRNEAALISSALAELLTAVSDLARIVDSVADCHADMPYVQDAIEAAKQHITDLKKQAA